MRTLLITLALASCLPTTNCRVETGQDKHSQPPLPDKRLENCPPPVPVATKTPLGVLTVTIYHAVPGQTDDSPMTTASNFDLTTVDIATARICALSRDLIKRCGGPISYGDMVWLDLPEPYKGWWRVEDTMARRWTNRADLLVPTTVKGGKWTEVNAFTKTNEPNKDQ